MKQNVLIISGLLALSVSVLNASPKSSFKLKSAMLRQELALAGSIENKDQAAMVVMSLASAESGETSPIVLRTTYGQVTPLAAGLLQSDTSYTWDGAAWVGLSRSTYTYDGSSHLTTLVYQTYESSAWGNYYQMLSTYDGSGRISTSTMQLWQANAWVNQAFSTYTYDGGGHLTQIVGQDWSGTQWANASRVTNTYTGNLVATRTTELWSSGAWSNWSMQTNTYDGQQHVTEELTQTWQGGAWVNQNRITSTFDGNGDETSSVSQAWQGSSWTNTTMNEYVYNGSHQPTLNTTSFWVGLWLAESYDTMKYASGRLSEEVSVDAFTNAVNRTQHSYNSDGQETVELSQDWDDGEGQWVNTGRNVWVYSGGTTPCCVGKRGNINQVGIIDLSDLSALVSYVTGGGYILTCLDAANVNGVGIVDLSDLSALVSYVTGGGYVLIDCP